MLNILGTIGIIALIIVCVIAIFIVLFLFVPIKYKVDSKVKYIPVNKDDAQKLLEYIKGEGEKEEAEVDFKLNAVISWLFHFLHIVLKTDEDGFRFKIKVIGITVFSTEILEKRKKKKKEKRRKAYLKRKKQKEKEREKQEKIDKLDNVKIRKSENTVGDSKNTAENNTEEFNNNTLENNDEGCNNKENSIDDTKQEVYITKTDKKESFASKVKGVFSKIKKIFGIIKDDSTKNTIRVVKTQLVRLIKEIKPRKFVGHVSYGAGDPVLTGKILGIISVIFGIIGKGCNVIPDFESKKVDAEIFIKGYFRIFVLLSVGLKLYNDKNIKKLIKKARNK